MYWITRVLQAALLVSLASCKTSTGNKKYKLDILDSTRFLPLPDVYKFLFTLQKLAPDSLKLQKIGNTRMPGKTWQNDIYAAVIGKDTDPIMLFDCGIHAREWISPATCLFTIQKLVRVFEARKHKKFKTSVTNYQWHIIPVLNPDGYNISHTSNRMHRKNARPLAEMQKIIDMDHFDDTCKAECESHPELCIGVDLNRNFPAGWGKGTREFERESTEVCRQTYKGEQYLSEPETQALNQHVRRNRHRLLSGISMHSYGMVIDHPNGWMKANDPNQADPKDIERMRWFIEGFNPYLNYSYGFVEDVFGPSGLAGGASEDFYYNYHDLKIAMTIELDPHQSDTHDWGFELPAEKIIPVGTKFWHAVQAMAFRMDHLKDSLMKLNMERSSRGARRRVGG